MDTYICSDGIKRACSPSSPSPLMCMCIYNLLFSFSASSYRQHKELILKCCMLFHYVDKHPHIHYPVLLCSVAQLYMTLLPHGLKLLCPWNFPGQNTGVGCHFLLQRIFWEALFITHLMSHQDISSFSKLQMILSKHPYRRRQWHPTPVLLPGKSHGRRSLVGCSPWGR